MSELSNRMIRDMRLAGLVEGTRGEYLRAVRQLTAYYMVSPDHLSERNVEDYLLYVRDELGVAKGTFAPIFAGLKFFYLNTLDYDWPLFTKKKSASHAGSGCPTSAVTRTAAARSPPWKSPSIAAVSRSSTPMACGSTRRSRCRSPQSTRSRWFSASSASGTRSVSFR